jgi:hypothetical protein
VYALNKLSYALVWIIVCICVTGITNRALAQHPVVTRGDIRSVYTETTSGGTGDTSANWVNLFTINANTYIWRPWFALFSGSLSLVDNQSESDRTSDSESTNLGGSIQLKLFPTSRFPFLFFASESRFEQNNEVSESIFTQRTIGMRQQYASWDNKTRVLANYQQQSRDIPGQAEAQSELFSLGASHLLENHQLSANLGMSQSSQTDKEDKEDVAFVAKHGYKGSREFSLENQLSASNSSNAFSSGTTDLRSRQFTSSTSWAPNDNRALRVTGNFRLDDKSQVFAPRVGDATSTTLSGLTANLSQGLTYRYNDNVTFSQSASINQTQSGGQDRTTAAESVGADYSGDTTETSLGSYTWFAAASLGNQHGEGIESRQSLSTQLGHNLSKELVVTPDVSLSAGFAQNIGITSTSEGDSDGSLGNSASLGWSRSESSNSSSVRASIADSRDFDNTFENQIFNLLANHNIRRDRFTDISSELTYQRTRTKSKNLDRDASQTQNLSGQLSYSDNKFLNIPGLGFKSLFDATKYDDLSSTSLNTNSDNSARYSWKNELRYNIGRFESRLTLDYIRTGQIDNRTIIIELTRKFGDR